MCFFHLYIHYDSHKLIKVFEYVYKVWPTVRRRDSVSFAYVEHLTTTIFVVLRWHLVGETKLIHTTA